MWAFCANPSWFSTLYMACLTLGFHLWHEAIVVIIPKPNKPDYSTLKAYRPISLLECIGKLLEKVVATCFLSDVNVFSLIPTNQFGSRDYSSAVDAAMAIAHNAESCLQSGTIGAMVLFDIQGFFDNISIPRLIRLCTDLGFPVAMCNWLSSFLHDRLVRLSFNGFSSNPITLDHGIPQGSPLSPILSTIFTSPLLKLINSSWWLWTLAMFVDDGSIFATGGTFRDASRSALSGFEQVLGWLHRNGLRADWEKTEFITFGHKHAHVGSPPDRVAIRDPTQGEYNVTRSTRVRYLGVFFHKRLDWSHHATIVSNRARSIVRALAILGNSIRGLHFASWWKVFHAIILPILTYASPVWFSARTKKKVLTILATILQTAQNDAICKISGCFKTTPTNALHHLLAILPIKFTLMKLHLNSIDRLECLPPSSQLHTSHTLNPVKLWPDFLPLRTCLPPPLESPPLFAFPNHPSETKWSHPRFSHSYL